MKRNFLAFSLAISMLLCASACSSSMESASNDELTEQDVEIVESVDEAEDVEEVEAEPEEAEEDEDAIWQAYAYRDLGNLGYATDVLSEVSVGDYVTFGSYEQDGNYLDGSEDIEWLVVDIQDGKALLLSRYALEVMAYNEEDGDTTWETSSIRAWLNDTFYNEAFTSDEQAAIALTANENPDSYNLWKNDGWDNYGADGGNETEDYVFLLSYMEVYSYFDGHLDVMFESDYNEKLICYPTEYAIDNWIQYVGQEEYEEYYAEDYPESMVGAVYWFLRSPGDSQDYAAVVDNVGVMWKKLATLSGSTGIRPAIWVSFE
jgi:hypothetical protein